MPQGVSDRIEGVIDMSIRRHLVVPAAAVLSIGPADSLRLG